MERWSYLHQACVPTHVSAKLCTNPLTLKRNCSPRLQLRRDETYTFGFCNAQTHGAVVGTDMHGRLLNKQGGCVSCVFRCVPAQTDWHKTVKSRSVNCSAVGRHLCFKWEVTDILHLSVKYTKEHSFKSEPVPPVLCQVSHRLYLPTLLARQLEANYKLRGVCSIVHYQFSYYMFRVWLSKRSLRAVCILEPVYTEQDVFDSHQILASICQTFIWQTLMRGS